MSKGTAFVMCYIAIVFIFCVMCVIGIIKADLGAIPTKPCLTALCSITAGFIGFQVANNGVRGRWWNPDMYARENNAEEENNDGAQQKNAGGAGAVGSAKV